MKTLDKCFQFIAPVFVIIIALSCSKTQNPSKESLPVYTDTGFDKHTVYMAGYYLDSNSTERAAYWVNGKMTLLDNYSSVATGIFVDGSDIYVSGYTYSFGLRNSRNYEAVYWKNNVKIPLNTLYPQSIGGILAYGIWVSNGNVHVIGEDRGHATIWINAVPFTLETKSSMANSIYISGNDIYVAGLIWKSNLRIATVWKNGISTSLGSGDSEADAVFVKDNDVFVGGYDAPSSSSSSGIMQMATYWKNGKPIVLDSLKYSRLAAIATDGNDLHAAGNTAYWKNNVPEFLNPGGLTSCSAIYLKDGEVFIAGSSIGGANTGSASVTLWHNNHQFNLPFIGAANSIYVK